jgi:dTDP-4-dehydrorhamnose 3,5-epimerase
MAGTTSGKCVEPGGMQLTETGLPGAYVIDLEPVEDARGFFARAWSARELSSIGLESRIDECNLSFNGRRGTLRGMHFQRPPHAEVKLIRCIKGALYDVIVDLRTDSPTFRHWVGFELDEENRRMLYVPRGFAHGFQTLADGTEVYYMISNAHVPEAAAGVRWNDPSFGIDWPMAEPTVISDKDRSWPDFTD